jgi:predicted DsbA family dithiol-disulfide isomerase/SAM-dependent methyltransferase
MDHHEASTDEPEELDPFWFPYHIEPNTFSVLTQDTYFDQNGAMVEGVVAVEGKPLGFMSVNALGDVVPMRELMDENDLAILMGAGGQMLTGGMLRAGLHGVRRDGNPEGLGRSLYFHAFYGNPNHTWQAPPAELEAAARAELSVNDSRILDIGDPIVKSMTGRTMNQVLYDFRRQFQRLPVGYETNGVQAQFESLAAVLPRTSLREDEGKIVIDVLTDLTCPIVYLALKRLKQALVSTGTEALVSLRYHMLLINPDMSDEGEDLDIYIKRLKNMTKEQYSAPDTPLNRAASQMGYGYAPDRRVIKPLMAHAAVQAAGPELHNAVYDELALRYNEFGEDINNLTVIAAVYNKFNIDASDMTALKNRLEASKEPILSLYEKLDSMVTTVPHFMLRDEATGAGFELDGALKQEAFDAALKRIASVPAKLTINGAALAEMGLNLPRGTLVPGFGGKNVLVSQVDRYASMTINSINLRAANWDGPPAWPYTSADFAREDENDDTALYSKPNFAKHIDDAALQSLTDTYLTLFSSSPNWQEDAVNSTFALLDTSSSWVSHYPSLPFSARVAVQGMNEQELLANELATERLVQDLNKNATLPYASESFDFVTSVAGMQYLTQPRDVIKEWHRVLKPGGVAIVSFTNRYFEQKATAIWKTSMAEEVALSNFVENCFRFAPQGEWENINSIDISPHHSEGDPMWVVMATKKHGSA